MEGSLSRGVVLTEQSCLLSFQVTSTVRHNRHTPSLIQNFLLTSTAFLHVSNIINFLILTVCHGVQNPVRFCDVSAIYKNIEKAKSQELLYTYKVK